MHPEWKWGPECPFYSVPGISTELCLEEAPGTSSKLKGLSVVQGRQERGDAGVLPQLDSAHAANKTEYISSHTHPAAHPPSGRISGRQLTLSLHPHGSAVAHPPTTPSRRQNPAVVSTNITSIPYCFILVVRCNAGARSPPYLESIGSTVAGPLGPCMGEPCKESLSVFITRMGTWPDAPLLPLMELTSRCQCLPGEWHSHTHPLICLP